MKHRLVAIRKQLARNERIALEADGVEKVAEILKDWPLRRRAENIALAARSITYRV